MSGNLLVYDPPPNKSSFLLHKHPSDAWARNCSKLRRQKDMSASIGITMDRSTLYQTLRTNRSELLVKYSHCIAISNPTRYQRTLRILNVDPKATETHGNKARLMQKVKSLNHMHKLPPLRPPRVGDSFDGFLELLSHMK